VYMREGKREIISMDGKEIKISRTKLVFRRHIYTLKLEKPIEISTSTPIETSTPNKRTFCLIVNLKL
jgi:hypothetical protein